MAEEKPKEKEVDQKLEEKSSKDAPKKKTSKLTCCLISSCAFIFIIMMIFSMSLFFRGFFSSFGDIPVPGQSSTPSSNKSATKTTTVSYPAPQNCNVLSFPNSSSLSVSPNNPGLKQNTKYHSYQIYGYTANDLAKQMSNCGPKSEGKPYDAITTYRDTWQWNLKPSYTDCAILDPVVGVNADIYLPEWNAQGTVQPGLESKWLTFLANLTTHENGHRDISVSGGEAILSALQNISPKSTCDEVNNEASATANSIFKTYDQKSHDYDTTTGHGRTQGAVFP